MKAKLAVFIIAIFFINGPLYCEECLITVDASMVKGRLNKKVFGNNLLGHVSRYKPFEKYGNYGAGIWDPVAGKCVPEAAQLAKEAGISMMRFPGGCGANFYNWKDSIGKRTEYLFGINEFLAVCGEIGAEPVFTVSYFTGDEKDDADLVEYLNGPNDGSNPNAGIDWALERANNGHAEPYNVKYFEIGNEVFNGNKLDVKQVTAAEYASRYLKSYESMKAVDQDICIGVVLESPSWNKEVMRFIKDKLDFGALHIYASTYLSKKQMENEEGDEIFKRLLADPVLGKTGKIKNALRVLKESSGKDVPVAVTEFNCSLNIDKPVPYRHSLGAALVICELLKVFMEPENNIIFADYWNFSNEYWGMVANGFNGKKADLYKAYYKRPNYLVFEMFANHFGTELLEPVVKTKAYHVWKDEVAYLSVNASLSEDHGTIYLMVINKDLNERVKTKINLRNFVPEKKIDVYVLNGPEVYSTNELSRDNVKISRGEIEAPGNMFEFSFEPHSVTTLEIKSSFSPGL